MKNRHFIYGLILLAMAAVWGCSKEDNVVAPSESTIEVTASSSSIKVGSPVTIRAVVKDSDGKELNGVGVIFASSDPTVASFSGTGYLPQVSADTDDLGVATVIVYGLKAGSADINADIVRASGSVSLTVTP